MNTFVIDASIAVKWVVEEHRTPEALALRQKAKLIALPVCRHLVDPIRPTRRHIAISPHGGLYVMPSLGAPSADLQTGRRAAPSAYLVQLFHSGLCGRCDLQSTVGERSGKCVMRLSRFSEGIAVSIVSPMSGARRDENKIRRVEEKLAGSCFSSE